MKWPGEVSLKRWHWSRDQPSEGVGSSGWAWRGELAMETRRFLPGLGVCDCGWASWWWHPCRRTLSCFSFPWASIDESISRAQSCVSGNSGASPGSWQSMLGELKILLVPLPNFTLWISFTLGPSPQRPRGCTASAGCWIPTAPLWNSLRLQELLIKHEDAKFLQNRAVKFGKEGTTLLVRRRGNKHLLRLSDDLAGTHNSFIILHLFWYWFSCFNGEQNNRGFNEAEGSFSLMYKSEVAGGSGEQSSTVPSYHSGAWTPGLQGQRWLTPPLQLCFSQQGGEKKVRTCPLVLRVWPRSCGHYFLLYSVGHRVARFRKQKYRTPS